MKNILFIAFTAASLLLSSGCKKKKSDPEPSDPCANTVCLNGGTCVDGSCSCPAGYTGSDCGTQKTPTKIAITGIKVTKYPVLDGSSTWDPITNTNPDVFAVLKQGSTNLITTGVTSNTTVQSIAMSGTYPVNVTDIVTQLNIELWDEDTPAVGDAHDSMGNINFSIYSSTNHFPTTLVVDNGTLTFELTLSYTY